MRSDGRERESLDVIVDAMSGTADPDERVLLDTFVRTLAQVTGCACLVHRDRGGRLCLAAASEHRPELVAELVADPEHGVVARVVRHRSPVIVTRGDGDGDGDGDALVAVPVHARGASRLHGVVVLRAGRRAPAPGEDTVRLAARAAWLLAGELELRQAAEATAALQSLASFSALLSEATRPEDLELAVVGVARKALGCATAQLYLRDATTGRLERAAADPADAPPVNAEALDRRAADADGGAVGAGDAEDARASRVTSLGRQMGLLAVTGARHGPPDDVVLQALARLVATGLSRRAPTHPTREDLARELFDALAARHPDGILHAAEAVGHNVELPHALVLLRPAGAAPERVAGREHVRAVLRGISPGVIVHESGEGIGAMLPLGETAACVDVERMQRLLGELAEQGWWIGRSAVRCGIEWAPREMQEATDALRVARALSAGGQALAYDELGAYRYLVRVPLEGLAEDRHVAAIERLVAYDGQRNSALLETLEQWIRARGSIATAARLLYIHPSTLRQRLDRITQVSGLDVDAEDLLQLDLVTKLVRLAG